MLSFEQSAYSKEIAEERQDTHKAQRTPEKFRTVLGQVDTARMRETFDLIVRARLEIREK